MDKHVCNIGGWTCFSSDGCSYHMRGMESVVSFPKQVYGFELLRVELVKLSDEERLELFRDYCLRED